MVVSNHNLLKFRAISLLVSAFFAISVYIDVSGIFMFPLFLLQLATFALAFLLKRKRKQKSLVEINLSASIALVVVYICAIALGVFASINASRAMEAVCSLLIYMVCLDALMAIPFVLSFTDKTKWQSGYSGSGFGNDSSVNLANGQAMTGYTDSSGCLPGCGTPSWPVETYTANPSNGHDW